MRQFVAFVAFLLAAGLPRPAAAVQSPGAAGADPPTGYQCEAGEGTPDARRACRSGFLAAAARAAAEAGAFSGTTRECLLELAAVQERAARMIRAGDPEGQALRQTVPACYAGGTPQWDYGALARSCPGGRWTAENQGVTGCAAASAPESPAGAAPADPLGEEARLREAIRLDPDVAAYHAALGALLRERHRLPEARAALEEAVRLEPESARYRQELQEVRLALGEGEAAAPELAGPVEAPPPAVEDRPLPLPVRIVTGLLLGASVVVLVLAGAMLLLPVAQALWLLLVGSTLRVLRRAS
jgi:tetratricopeptide (TPR) repeat protein